MGDLVSRAEELEDEMRMMFSRFDINKDDAISKEELENLLEALGILGGHDVEEKKKIIQEQMTLFDDNKDGKIVFEEFKAHYNGLIEYQKSVATKRWVCGAEHKQAVHDLFISYRVSADGAFAEKLAMTIEAAPRKNDPDGKASVFLDKFCLRNGEDWEVGFLSGLSSARIAVLVISVKSLEGIKSNASSKQDNVLLEYEKCVAMLEASPNFAVLPILVGTYADVDGQKALIKFKCPRVEDFPDVPHASPKSTGRTIRSTMAALFKLQGIKADPEDLKSLSKSVFDFREDILRKLSKDTMRKRPDVLALFEKIDENTDGFVDLAELTARVLAVDADAQVDIPALMESCDGNRDGKLSFLEFAEAFDRLGEGGFLKLSDWVVGPGGLDAEEEAEAAEEDVDDGDDKDEGGDKENEWDDDDEEEANEEERADLEAGLVADLSSHRHPLKGQVLKVKDAECVACDRDLKKGELALVCKKCELYLCGECYSTKKDLVKDEDEDA